MQDQPAVVADEFRLEVERGRVGRGAGVVSEFRQIAPGHEVVEPQGQRRLPADGLRRAHAQLPRPTHLDRRRHGHDLVAPRAVRKPDLRILTRVFEPAAQLSVVVVVEFPAGRCVT